LSGERRDREAEGEIEESEGQGQEADRASDQQLEDHDRNARISLTLNIGDADIGHDLRDHDFDRAHRRRATAPSDIESSARNPSARNDLGRSSAREDKPAKERGVRYRIRPQRQVALPQS